MTKYHLLPGFRVRVVKRSTQDHWQGGPAYHAGAACPICRRPLLLLWDVNCADPRFRLDGRLVFKHLERLPLYYCWKCAAEMDYRVLSPDRIQVLQNLGKPQGEDFPYRRFPQTFERRPIELDRLTDMPKEARALLNTDWFDRLPTKAKRPLEKWIGRPLKYGFDIWWHQFGGIPWLVQGPERIFCPNRDCSWARRRWAMKVLAVIRNDPPAGLPMCETMKEVEKRGGHFNDMVQVVFHICKCCLTIHVGNRCD